MFNTRPNGHKTIKKNSQHKPQPHQHHKRAQKNTHTHSSLHLKDSLSTPLTTTHSSFSSQVPQDFVKTKRVLIIGGGISGYTLCHSIQMGLKKRGYRSVEITLVDSNKKPGGWVQTSTYPFLTESGPRSLLMKKGNKMGTPDDRVRWLLESLNLEDSFVPASKKANAKFLFRDGDFHNAVDMSLKTNFSGVIVRNLPSIISFALGKRSSYIHNMIKPTINPVKLPNLSHTESSFLLNGDNMTRNLQRDAVIYGYRVDTDGQSMEPYFFKGEEILHDDNLVPLKNALKIEHETNEPNLHVFSPTLGHKIRNFPKIKKFYQKIFRKWREIMPKKLKQLSTRRNTLLLNLFNKRRRLIVRDLIELKKEHDRQQALNWSMGFDETNYKHEDDETSPELNNTKVIINPSDILAVSHSQIGQKGNKNVDTKTLSANLLTLGKKDTLNTAEHVSLFSIDNTASLFQQISYLIQTGDEMIKNGLQTSSPKPTLPSPPSPNNPLAHPDDHLGTPISLKTLFQDSAHEQTPQNPTPTGTDQNSPPKIDLGTQQLHSITNHIFRNYGPKAEDRKDLLSQVELPAGLNADELDIELLDRNSQPVGRQHVSNNAPDSDPNKPTSFEPNLRFGFPSLRNHQVYGYTHHHDINIPGYGYAHENDTRDGIEHLSSQHDLENSTKLLFDLATQNDFKVKDIKKYPLHEFAWSTALSVKKPFMAFPNTLKSASVNRVLVRNGQVLDQFGLPDETVGDFFSREVNHDFTRNLIDPMVAGIYSGNIYKVSMSASFPEIVAKESRKGLFSKIQLAPPSRYRSPQSDRFITHMVNSLTPEYHPHLSEPLHPYYLKSASPKMFHNDASLQSKLNRHQWRSKYTSITFKGGMNTLPTALHDAVTGARSRFLRDGLSPLIESGPLVNSSVSMSDAGIVTTTVLSNTKVLYMRPVHIQTNAKSVDIERGNVAVGLVYNQASDNATNNDLGEKKSELNTENDDKGENVDNSSQKSTHNPSNFLEQRNYDYVFTCIDPYKLADIMDHPLSHVNQKFFDRYSFDNDFSDKNKASLDEENVYTGRYDRSSRPTRRHVHPADHMFNSKRFVSIDPKTGSARIHNSHLKTALKRWVIDPNDPNNEIADEFDDDYSYIYDDTDNSNNHKPHHSLNSLLTLHKPKNLPSTLKPLRLPSVDHSLPLSLFRLKSADLDSMLVLQYQTQQLSIDSLYSFSLNYHAQKNLSLLEGMNSVIYQALGKKKSGEKFSGENGDSKDEKNNTKNAKFQKLIPTAEELDEIQNIRDLPDVPFVNSVLNYHTFNYHTTTPRILDKNYQQMIKNKIHQNQNKNNSDKNREENDEKLDYCDESKDGSKPHLCRCGYYSDELPIDIGVGQNFCTTTHAVPGTKGKKQFVPEMPREVSNNNKASNDKNAHQNAHQNDQNDQNDQNSPPVYDNIFNNSLIYPRHDLESFPPPSALSNQQDSSYSDANNAKRNALASQTFNKYEYLTRWDEQTHKSTVIQIKSRLPRNHRATKLIQCAQDILDRSFKAHLQGLDIAEMKEFSTFTPGLPAVKNLTEFLSTTPKFLEYNQNDDQNGQQNDQSNHKQGTNLSTLPLDNITYVNNTKYYTPSTLKVLPHIFQHRFNAEIKHEQYLEDLYNFSLKNSTKNSNLNEFSYNLAQLLSSDSTTPYIHQSYGSSPTQHHHYGQINFPPTSPKIAPNPTTSPHSSSNPQTTQDADIESTRSPLYTRVTKLHAQLIDSLQSAKVLVDAMDIEMNNLNKTIATSREIITVWGSVPLIVAENNQELSMAKIKKEYLEVGGGGDGNKSGQNSDKIGEKFDQDDMFQDDDSTLQDVSSLLLPKLHSDMRKYEQGIKELNELKRNYETMNQLSGLITTLKTNLAPKDQNNNTSGNSQTKNFSTMTDEQINTTTNQLNDIELVLRIHHVQTRKTAEKSQQPLTSSSSSRFPGTHHKRTLDQTSGETLPFIGHPTVSAVSTALRSYEMSSMTLFNVVLDNENYSIPDGFGLLVPTFSHMQEFYDNQIGKNGQIGHKNNQNDETPLHHFPDFTKSPLYGLLGVTFDSTTFPDLYHGHVLNYATQTNNKIYEILNGRFRKTQTAKALRDEIINGGDDGHNREYVQKVNKKDGKNDNKSQLALNNKFNDKKTHTITLMGGGARFPDFVNNSPTENILQLYNWFKVLHSSETTQTIAKKKHQTYINDGHNNDSGSLLTNNHVNNDNHHQLRRDLTNVKLPTPLFIRVNKQIDCIPQPLIGTYALQNAIQNDINHLFGYYVRAQQNGEHLFFQGDSNIATTVSNTSFNQNISGDIYTNQGVIWPAVVVGGTVSNNPSLKFLMANGTNLGLQFARHIDL